MHGAEARRAASWLAVERRRWPVGAAAHAGEIFPTDAAAAAAHRPGSWRGQPAAACTAWSTWPPSWDLSSIARDARCATRRSADGRIQRRLALTARWSTALRPAQRRAVERWDLKRRRRNRLASVGRFAGRRWRDTERPRLAGDRLAGAGGHRSSWDCGIDRTTARFRPAAPLPPETSERRGTDDLLQDRLEEQRHRCQGSRRTRRHAGQAGFGATPHPGQPDGGRCARPRAWRPAHRHDRSGPSFSPSRWRPSDPRCMPGLRRRNASPRALPVIGTGRCSRTAAHPWRCWRGLHLAGAWWSVDLA